MVWGTRQGSKPHRGFGKRTVSRKEEGEKMEIKSAQRHQYGLLTYIIRGGAMRTSQTDLILKLKIQENGGKGHLTKGQHTPESGEVLMTSEETGPIRRRLEVRVIRS